MYRYTAISDGLFKNDLRRFSLFFKKKRKLFPEFKMMFQSSFEETSSESCPPN